MSFPDTASPRVRPTGPDEVEARIAGLIAAPGPVLRLVGPGTSAAPVDASALPEGFTGVLVDTSGSTGSPKTVMLGRDALIAAARAANARLGGPGGWVNPLPVWYVAGLMTVVRAVVSGERYFGVGPHLEGLAVPARRAYLSVVPPQLHAGLADREHLARLAGFAAVLVGGGPVDAGLLGRARRLGVNAIATYGMSETCGGVVYDGHPLDGVTVSFQDPAGRPADEGRIRITTPTVFSGYLGDSALTSQVLDSPAFVTSDRGRLVDGRLEVLGRIDDIVYSGGVGVDLAALQRLLDAAFPDRTACFAVAHPVWGASVVVASAGVDPAAIRARLDETAGGAARPRGFLELPALPRTPSGKIDRPALAEIWRIRGERA